MEGFELEEAFKGLQSNPPCTEQGHLQLQQVAQSHVQSDLKCFQGWASTTSLDNLLPGLHILIAKIPSLQLVSICPLLV